jgi:hypothetical protein
MPKWLKKLKVSQRKHLKEMRITSLRQFKEVAEMQKKRRDEHKVVTGLHEPCYDCKEIAARLDLPV